MTKEEIEIGQSYKHDFGDGRLWNVRVTGFDQNYPDEWVGVLDGEQAGLEDGCHVWGKIHELRLAA